MGAVSDDLGRGARLVVAHCGGQGRKAPLLELLLNQARQSRVRIAAGIGLGSQSHASFISFLTKIIKIANERADRVEGGRSDLARAGSS